MKMTKTMKTSNFSFLTSAKQNFLIPLVLGKIKRAFHSITGSYCSSSLSIFSFLFYTADAVKLEVSILDEDLPRSFSESFFDELLISLDVDWFKDSSNIPP